MSDYVGLAFDVADKLIEKKFDDIPSGAFHPEKKIRKFRKRRKNKDRSRSRSTSRSDDDINPRGRSRRDNSQDDYSDGVYDASRNSTARADPYWEEAERRTRDRYAYATPSSAYPDADPRYPAQHRDPYAHPNDAFAHPPNTYSDSPSSSTYYLPPQRVYTPPVADQSQRPRSHSTNQRSSRRVRPALKQRPSSLERSSPNPLGHFSSTERGLGAGSLGALAGGFVAQEWAKRDKRGRKTDPMLLTLVGAAIGGLGANALEGKWERGKMREREKERNRGD